MVTTVDPGTLSAKHSESIRKIDELDLSMVKMKLCLPVEEHGKGWSPDQCETAELWYKRYLKLCVLRGKRVVPTKLIDEFWHAHILDTRRYHEDCHNIFGGYMHHDPYLGLNGDHETPRKAFNGTLALFEEFFGENPVLDGDASGCQGGSGQGNCSWSPE